jgi:hypothetical protein
MELNGLNQVRNNDANFVTDNVNRPIVPQEWISLWNELKEWQERKLINEL